MQPEHRVEPLQWQRGTCSSLLWFPILIDRRWYILTFARRMRDSARRAPGSSVKPCNRARRPSYQPRPGGRCRTWRASRPRPTTTRAPPRSRSLWAHSIAILMCSCGARSAFDTRLSAAAPCPHPSTCEIVSLRRPTLSLTLNLIVSLILLQRASQVRVRSGPRHRPVPIPANLRRFPALRHLQPRPQHLRRHVAAVHLARQ